MKEVDAKEAKRLSNKCDELALDARFVRSEDIRAVSYKFMLAIQEQMLVAAKREERERKMREIGEIA